MSEIVLNAEIRRNLKSHAKASRIRGNVPGVFYIHGETNVPIEVPALNLNPLIYTHETHVIDLRLSDGSAKKCILRDVQFDPVTDRPIHFDLQGLKENEKLTLEVPIVLTGGIPIGVREGGMLQHVIHKLKISCFPRHIPEKIEINVGMLAMNHSVHVRDLNVSDVTILDNLESTVVAVLPPTVQKEADTAVVEETEMKEPEVVGKGKKTDEEDGAEGGKEEKKK